MDEDGRGGGPPVTTLPGDGASAGQRAATAGRLDDWWDPAWDAVWWDPAWNVDRPADAAPPMAAPGRRGEAAPVADSTEPGIPASLPDESPGNPAGPAAAVQGGPSALQRTPPDAPVGPSWGQVLTTTIGLWAARRLPRVGIVRVRDRWQRGTRLRSPLRRPPGRRPHPAQGPVVLERRLHPMPGPVVLGACARRPRLAACGPTVPVRLLAVSMLGAGLLAVAAGTAGLLVANGSPAAPVWWVARPSPVAVPPGRAVPPARLATVQQTARPVWLTVPAIGVRTRLVDLGLNRNGTLQVPASTAVAGWFTGSPRPGAIGSAVIAGHVDSRTGPAVFFRLRTMRPGERIYVGRADGTLAVFTVTSVRMYPKDEFPTAGVYGPVPDAELRLITCGGIFDQSLGSYLSNVVVYARLTR